MTLNRRSCSSFANRKAKLYNDVIYFFPWIIRVASKVKLLTPIRKYSTRNHIQGLRAKSPGTSQGSLDYSRLLHLWRLLPGEGSLVLSYATLFIVLICLLVPFSMLHLFHLVLVDAARKTYATRRTGVGEKNISSLSCFVMTFSDDVFCVAP